MNNQIIFTKLFIEFEEETKKKLNFKYDKLDDCIEELRNKRINPYLREYSFIEFCRRLRNINSHNVNDNYYLITDDTINKLKLIINEVKHPYKVIDKAIKNIYSKNLEDNVLKTMIDMNNKSYTHIPIYSSNNKELIGIFSEKSLFQYVLEDKIIEIDDNTKFKDLIDCIDLEKSKEIVKFVSKDKLYDLVVEEFIKEFKNGNKLSCVMITNSGSNKEKVIGILTSWDVVGND